MNDSISPSQFDNPDNNHETCSGLQESAYGSFEGYRRQVSAPGGETDQAVFERVCGQQYRQTGRRYRYYQGNQGRPQRTHVVWNYVPGREQRGQYFYPSQGTYIPTYSHEGGFQPYGPGGQPVRPGQRYIQPGQDSCNGGRGHYPYGRGQHSDPFSYWRQYDGGQQHRPGQGGRFNFWQPNDGRQRFPGQGSRFDFWQPNDGRQRFPGQGSRFDFWQPNDGRQRFPGQGSRFDFWQHSDAHRQCHSGQPSRFSFWQPGDGRQYFPADDRFGYHLRHPERYYQPWQQSPFDYWNYQDTVRPGCGTTWYRQPHYNHYNYRRYQPGGWDTGLFPRNSDYYMQGIWRSLLGRVINGSCRTGYYDYQPWGNQSRYYYQNRPIWQDILGQVVNRAIWGRYYPSNHHYLRNNYNWNRNRGFYNGGFFNPRQFIHRGRNLINFRIGF